MLFVAHLRHYVLLKRRREVGNKANFQSGQFQHSGYYYVGAAEVFEARTMKNEFLRRLAQTIGEDEALELQRKEGSKLSLRGMR